MRVEAKLIDSHAILFSLLLKCHISQEVPRPCDFIDFFDAVSSYVNEGDVEQKLIVGLRAQVLNFKPLLVI